MRLNYSVSMFAKRSSVILFGYQLHKITGGYSYACLEQQHLYYFMP